VKHNARYYHEQQENRKGIFITAAFVFIEYEIVIRSRPSWLWTVGGHIQNYYITILLYDFCIDVPSI